MKSLTQTEIRWIISALEFTAENCKAQASELTGVLKGIALQAEDNNRATANKLKAVLSGNNKRLDITF